MGDGIMEEVRVGQVWKLLQQDGLACAPTDKFVVVLGPWGSSRGGGYSIQYRPSMFDFGATSRVFGRPWTEFAGWDREILTGKLGPGCHICESLLLAPTLHDNLLICKNCKETFRLIDTTTSDAH